MKKDIKILAIETSCDETSAAVIGTEELKNGRTEEHPVILSNVVSSSADLHAKTGGIVPEVASRAQMEAIMPVMELALKQANSNDQALMLNQEPNSKFPKTEHCNLNIEHLLSDITHIAATNGPGLIGSLLVGFNAAKTIAYARNLPFLPINHTEGHIYSAFAEYPNEVTNSTKVQNYEKISDNQRERSALEFPILALTVSGGHTSLTLMKNHGKYETVGETLDDAAGEAFDKVAKLLGLGYPGGPVVSKYAGEFRNRSMKREARSKRELKPHTPYSQLLTPINFPRPLIDKPNFDFSFSGLKTAVLTQTIKHPVKTAKQKEEICWAFEEAAVDVLVTKTIRAAQKYHPRAVILAGGVAANKRLREVLSFNLKSLNLDLLMPPIELCGDNAAMIGLAAYYHIIKSDKFDLFSATVDSNLEL